MEPGHPDLRRGPAARGPRGSGAPQAPGAGPPWPWEAVRYGLDHARPSQLPARDARLRGRAPERAAGRYAGGDPRRTRHRHRRSTALAGGRGTRLRPPPHPPSARREPHLRPRHARARSRPLPDRRPHAPRPRGAGRWDDRGSPRAAALLRRGAGGRRPHRARAARGRGRVRHAGAGRVRPGGHLRMGRRRRRRPPAGRRVPRRLRGHLADRRHAARARQRARRADRVPRADDHGDLLRGRGRQWRLLPAER